MATISVRKGTSGKESYRVGYYDKDGKFAFTPTMKNREGAERIATIIDKQGYEVALKVLKVTQKSTMLTLREHFKNHLERKSITVTDGTIAGYEREAERTWMGQLGDYPLDTITEDSVVNWVRWQMQQPTHRSQVKRANQKRAKITPLSPIEYVAPKTVRNAHGLLSSVLESAVHAGIINKNVAKRVPVPKDPVREEKPIFSREEWEAFYAAMQDEFKAFTGFLLVTCCRIGEATATRVCDINFKANTVSVIQAWKKARKGDALGTPKSSRSRRVIMVDPWVIDALRPLAEGKKYDDLLFTGQRGGRIYPHIFRERQWEMALRRSGIDKYLTPHSLRHTFGSWQLMAGVAPQVVQMRMGHESLATTSKVYAHLLLEEQISGAAAIGWTPPKAQAEIEILRI